MSDFSSPKKTEAVWEPGTLDNTRRNIGPIDQNEAKKMMKKLGGEILGEKSAPINYDSLPKSKEYAKRAVASSPRPTGKSANSASSAFSGNKYGYTAPEKSSSSSSSYTLPEIPSKERQMMDRLMMSEEFKIKPNYGFFNFVRKFMRNGSENVRRSFIQFTIPKHLMHIQEFINTVKSIIQISPDTYKDKIMKASEEKFRFLRLISSWDIGEINKQGNKLIESEEDVTVAMMIPFVKIIYKNFLKIYYLGETKITNFFKEIYSDLMKYPKFDQKKILLFSKTGITEWFYIYSQIIKGMYPLLMRMCSQRFDYFQNFFLTQTPAILKFVELTKFDLILANKKDEKKSDEPDKPKEKTPEEIKAEEEEKQKAREQAQKKSEIIQAGLKLLDNLFPEAGFLKLESFPDMFPYFQPIYQFRDGFNLLSNENPLQVTIVLLKILEDIFQGCGNIDFTEEVEGEDNSDKLSQILSEWTAYREVLFEKFYCEQLVDFVNNQYSKSDYKTSLFGKKMLTSVLWQTKFNFLPHFEFDQLLLEKPKNESQYRPLCIRTGFMLRYLGNLVKQIETASKTKGQILGISNPWEKYKFDLPNPVSRRIDVLLGAKKLTDSAATNANLIRYAYFIMTVLDWWINDETSPAYAMDSSKTYRINEDDGAPAFSVPLRSDQNKLFTERVKQTIERQKANASAK